MTKPRAPRDARPPAPKDEPGSIHDVTWDDDTAPHLDFDERAFDRVTAIPEMPPELFAKQLMEAAAAAEKVRPDPASEAKTAKPEPASEAPPLSVPKAPSVPFELTTSKTLPTGAERDPEPTPISGSPGVAGTGPISGRQRGPAFASVDPSSAPRTVRGALPLELDVNALDGGFANPEEDPALRELVDRHAMGDFSGALVLAEGVLENNPDHPEALRYAKNCRDVLTSMYAARLGPLNQIVRVVIPTEQIRWLSLDHRAGFLLSLVDGISTLEEILDISGMARLDALRIMYSLREERVITLSPK